MDKFIPFLSLICNAAWNTIEFAIEFDHVAYVEFHLMLNKTNFLDWKKYIYAKKNYKII